MKNILITLFSLFALQANSQTVVRVDTIDEPTPVVEKAHMIMDNGSFEDFKKKVAIYKRPYMIIFGASWCQPCQKLKKEVFTDPLVAGFSNQQYLVYYLDLESFDGLEANNEFRVESLPILMFFDSTGKKKEELKGSFDAFYLYKKMRENL